MIHRPCLHVEMARIEWELLKPRLCCLHFRGVVAHDTRHCSNPVKGQLGFMLHDLHNVKY